MPSLSLKINSSKFPDLIDKLQDLASISDIIKLKINEDSILAYSMISNDVSVLALKNYTLSTSEYIDNFKDDKELNYVILGASKFVKNLKIFQLNITN
jgi:hypothetical protein